MKADSFLLLGGRLLLFGLLPLMASGQRTIVPAAPTLNDRYPKRYGHLRADNFLYDIGTVRTNETKSDTMWFYNDGDRPMSIKVVGPLNDPFRLPEDVQLSPAEQVIPSAKEGYLLISVDGKKAERLGFQLDNFRLLTDDSDQPLKNISIGSYIAEYFPPLTAVDSIALPKVRLISRQIDYGKVVAGDKVTATVYVYNDGKRDLAVRSAYCSIEGLRFTFSAMTVPPSDSIRMEIEFDTQDRKPGPSLHRISLFVNDPAEPEVRIELTGKVE